VVHLTDTLSVGHDHVIEELLAEVGAAVDLTDDAQRDARRVDRHPEPGETAVLRHAPVRARQAQAVL
jgi:urease accessory protein UreE